jgi:uncharacterized membrane protein YdjX (TVP38/TMEM64 family)
MKRPVAVIAAVLLAVALAAWSYGSGGLVRVLVELTLSGDDALDALRAYVLGWGALAPAVYVLAVTVEVLIAPIPGALLYAPGGAIFGGLVGGTLSLIGNVLGAAIAGWIGHALGERWVEQRLGERLHVMRDRLARRGLWVIFLLRVNPFTSSDVVSYAAGAIGVPVRKVALGTLAGMAPLCYLQAYLAEGLFEILPGSGLVLLAFGAAYVVVLGWVLLKK